MKKEEIKIGMPVIFYHEITNGEKLHPVKTSIRSGVWNVCGSEVCKVVGIAGGVCLTHLEPLPTTEEEIEENLRRQNIN